MQCYWLWDNGFLSRIMPSVATIEHHYKWSRPNRPTQTSHWSRGRDFSLFLHVQTGSGAHPSYCPINTKTLFPGKKLPELEADRSPLFRAEVKNACSFTAIPTARFRCVVLAHRGCFISIFGDTDKTQNKTWVGIAVNPVKTQTRYLRT